MAKLYFYYSAMNAGKSTNLLQSDYNYRERGMDTILFTPAIDDRYGTSVINSRIGIHANAISIEPSDDLYNYVVNQLRSRPNIKCILVDEAQFLSKAQVFQLSDIVDKLHLPVLAYGLRSDFRATPFEGSLHLLALADELSELKTVCHCGRKAIMNMRIDAQGNKISEGAQVVIGGNDSYIATCRKHFKAGDSGVKQTTQQKTEITEEVLEEV